MCLVSTTMFHFLLRKVFETYQVYYTVSFTIDFFEFIFTLSLKHISCILKKPLLFFQMACLQDYKSLLAEFLCHNKLYYVVFLFYCIQLFPTFFMSQVFQGPGFQNTGFSGSGSRSRVWVQVLEVAH